MSTDQPIDAVRNRKNQKLFIVVDDTIEARYKVINPAGETLILPDLLFDEDPVQVPPSEAAKEFSAEQLDALKIHREKVAAQEAFERSRPKPPPRPVETIVVPPSKPRAPRSASPKKELNSSQRRGLGAQWSSPKLTFYKHKIEPLGNKQSFRISVDGTGDYEFTKEEFLSQFNDVCMSMSYRSEGQYSYSQVPDKAQRFKKS